MTDQPPPTDTDPRSVLREWIASTDAAAEISPDDFAHFAELARQGASGGDSSGEIAAATIAAVLAEHASALDNQAVEELGRFALYCWSRPGDPVVQRHCEGPRP